MRFFGIVCLLISSTLAIDTGLNIKLLSINDNYYTMEPIHNLTFDDANQYCKSFGGKLAQPATINEMRSLVAKLARRLSFWIGFRAEDQFEYVSEDNKYFHNSTDIWHPPNRCGSYLVHGCCAIAAHAESFRRYHVSSVDCDSIVTGQVICEVKSFTQIDTTRQEGNVVTIFSERKKNREETIRYCKTFEGGKLMNTTTFDSEKKFQCLVTNFTRHVHSARKSYVTTKGLKLNYFDADKLCRTRYLNGKLAEPVSDDEIDWLRNELYDWRWFTVGAKRRRASKNYYYSNQKMFPYNRLVRLASCVSSCCAIKVMVNSDISKPQSCYTAGEFVCEYETDRTSFVQNVPFPDVYADEEVFKKAHLITIVIVVIGAPIAISSLLITAFLIYVKCSHQKTSKITAERTFMKAKTEETSFVEELPTQSQDINLDHLRRRSKFTISNLEIENLPFKEDFLFPEKNIFMKKQLGEGFFGQVFLAEAVGLELGVHRTLVAIKTIKDFKDEKQKRALEEELRIMMHFERHLNIVNLLGVVRRDTGELMMMVEFCAFGDLREFLIANRVNFVDQVNCKSIIRSGSQLSNEITESTSEELNTTDLIMFAFQIAIGMEFLSSKKLIHRDLAARNVLVCDNKVVKICDFGLAKDVYKYQYFRQKSEIPLPLKWMAIESLRDGKFSSKSDVWSFGVLVWEIFSLGEMPFPFTRIDLHFLELLRNGIRMPRPEKCPETIYAIMKSCWELQPEDRPDFAALNQLLGDMLEDAVKKPYRVLQKECQETIYQTGLHLYANLQL